MEHKQYSREGRHDDYIAISDFLASLKDYTPTIPDELVEHYLAFSFAICSVITRLVAVATQKFVAEVATDALRYDYKFRLVSMYSNLKNMAMQGKQETAVKDKRDKQQKDKHLILTMENLSKALCEYGVNVKHQEYFADSTAGLGPLRGERTGLLTLNRILHCGLHFELKLIRKTN
ncbi:transcription initiation factor TFIID subunit 10-like [Actinidia eriantha]|uniref:transcription initiation factor TFIID subunit 10-like n=1 Tax=Actinidia eriantha TaxID=165200 RepID=UPI00258E9FB6|nr:transcription initiation factor TFIID subunit 10-like [Actinidia eriantha]